MFDTAPASNSVKFALLEGQTPAFVARAADLGLPAPTVADVAADPETAAAPPAPLACCNDNAPLPNLAAKGGLAPWQVRRVSTHIEANVEGAIGVGDLAALVRLSVSQFSRAFRQSFGQAPHAYVMCRRVARAQRLMLGDSEPLSQIALAVGLADQAHLSKLFRRHTGETPNAWRRAHWEEPDLAGALQ